MENYKSYRYIDGKARWVINDENGDIIDKNPTKEQLKNSILEEPPKKCCICGENKTYIDPTGVERWYSHNKCNKLNCTKYICSACNGKIYNGTIDHIGNKISKIRVDHSNTICCKCGERDTGKKIDGKPLWLRYVGEDNKGEWNGKSYTCTKCNSNIRNKMEYSYNNLIKLMSQSRNGKLSKYCETGEGLIVEAVVAKIRKLKVSTLELNSFRSKFDASYDQEYRRIQVKGPTFDGRRWDAVFGIDHNFDTLFIICVSKDRKYVDRVYIVQESELYGERRVYIYEDFSKLLTVSKYEWIEKFRMDQKTKEIYDFYYQDLIYYLKNKEFFGIEDIKEWLKWSV